jgi:nucleotide-binding universal stress UspA family protein
VLDAATELDSDVILIGSRGSGTMRGRLLGSVSSQVVDHARCSVMVFPARQKSSPAHIANVVVGVDGSPGAAAAIAAGTTLASALDARLVLLAAFESTTALAPATDLRAELRRDAERVLATARASVPADIEVVEELREGPPRQLLLEASERFGPSVLAVGTRGLGGFKGLLLGSTSRSILHDASCPVLVARRRP